MTRRYLRYDESRPAARGINHMLANLQCLLREAHASGRLAVLPTLRLAGEHNFGVARDWCWDDYFDLAGSRLVDAGGTALPLPLVAAVPAEVGAAVHLAPRASLTDRAARATLVARHMRGSVHRRDVPRRCRPYVGFRMRPSARVRSLAAPVVAALRERGQGDFAAVHVRRGDRLAAPWLRRLVAPQRIVRRLRRSGVPAGAVLFVLADEDVADLSASLAPAFASASRADFAALSALVAGPEPDNYLLYEVEKEVMRAAGVRIETHPGPRIDVSARSTDPHATLIPRSAWLLHRLFGKLRDARWVPGRLWARAQARLGSRRIATPSGPAGEGGRYLRYDEAEPVQRGINHLTRNLEVLLREAHLLGRVAVLPALHLAPKHNFGVDRQWRWETYYDFDGSRLVDASGKSHPLPLVAAPPSRCARALVVAAGERVPGSATGHPLIVRRITKSVFGKEVRFAAVGPPDFRFRPSPRVRQLARRVVSELRRRGGGSFHAVHVRRGDRLFGPMRWLTRPQRIRARLRAVDVPTGRWCTCFPTSAPPDSGTVSPCTTNWSGSGTSPSFAAWCPRRRRGGRTTICSTPWSSRSCAARRRASRPSRVPSTNRRTRPWSPRRSGRSPNLAAAGAKPPGGWFAASPGVSCSECSAPERGRPRSGRCTGCEAPGGASAPGSSDGRRLGPTRCREMQGSAWRTR